MSEMTQVSAPHKLSSQLKVSWQTAQKPLLLEETTVAQEIRQLEMQMERIDHAFSLVQEIHSTLEAALRDL